MKGFKSAGFVLVGALALAGCGGGGGGGDTPVELVGLDGENSAAAASTAYYAVSVVDGIPDLGAIVMPATVQQSGSERFVLRDFAKEQLDKLLRSGSQLSTNTVRAAAADSEVELCTDGGTITFTFNDVAPINEPSAGDSFRATFNDCKEGMETGNGSMVLTIGKLNQYEVEATLVFQNLNLDFGVDSISLNGDYKFGFNELTATATSAIGSFTLAYTDGSYSRSISLRGYSATAVYNDSTLETSLTFKGTIVDSMLGAGISVATLRPFKIGDYEDYPYDGSMTITGKNKSSVTLTALNSVYVQLDIDANGDGSPEPEKTVIMTWTELEAMSEAAPL